jgi:16S rRNA C967 or C1407 C5-methylase (RsmB/RsmF family)/NOL1/NOP2/fmu family ribosome biogenesis protein
MLPEEFKRRLSDQQYIDSEALLKALEEPSPVSIRINRGKWQKKPSGSEPVPWCNNGFYLKNRPSFTLDPLFHSGCYYPQEASSMFLEQAILQTIDSLENIRVLDLCGAPGGKSTHLSDLIGPDNLLVANEAIRSRAAILAETLTKWGSGNTIVTQNDPVVFGRLSGYFDIIVVDAPCSGEGMFRGGTAPVEWSVSSTIHCAERQKRILMDVWPALKENGILVYSTCTFNPGENEENIKWLTGKHKAEIVRLNIDEFKGITEIDYQGIYGYGLYPDKIRGEGFFLSVIRKTGKQAKNHIRSQRKPELKPAGEDFTVADRWTSFSRQRLLKWSGELFAVSCNMDEYLHIYQNLKILKAGTRIFIVKNNDYLPSHELALSLQLKSVAFPRNEIDLREALSFMRRDSLIFHNTANEWNIVTYKGVCLGFIKNIGNRVNNYFPVEWRIRMNLPLPGKENIIKWEGDGNNIK